jgi:hypothetical protein
MAYVHVHATHVEDAWIAGKSARRWGWAGRLVTGGRPVTRADGLVDLENAESLVSRGGLSRLRGTVLVVPQRVPER